MKNCLLKDSNLQKYKRVKLRRKGKKKQIGKTKVNNEKA